MEYKQLSRKRGSIKHSLTSCKTYINSKTDKDISDEDVIELEGRVERLEAIYIEFGECQGKIEEVCDDTKTDEEYAERDKFEETYFQIRAKAKAIINTKKSEGNEWASASGAAPVGSVIGQFQKLNAASHVKLPTMQLPRFKGSYDSWLEFRDAFTSIIHTNEGLSNVQKLQYLKSTVEGQAAQVIRAIETSETNYQVAWKILCDRYDNKNILMSNHVNGLFNLTTVKQESASELRKLVDEVTKHVIALKTLGEPMTKCILLTHLIINKFDSQTKREWQTIRQGQGDELPSVDEIINFVLGRCELLSTLEGNQKIRNATVHTTNKYTEKVGGSENSRSITTLVATGEREGEAVKVRCSFCETNGHYIYSCENFSKLNPNERTEEAKRKKLCLNCLKRNHFSTECRASSCRKCHKKHNTLLHFERASGRRQEQTSSTDADSTPGEIKGQDSARVVANYSTTNTQVLLSTAMIKVYSIDGKEHCARALLDCGSESSFITAALAEKLTVRRAKSNIFVIGLNQEMSRVTEIAHLTMHSTTSNYKVQAECLIIEKITENVPSVSYTRSLFKIPGKIILADPTFYQSGQVDVLLGANVFWEILCAERITLGPNLPIIQRTQLGWVLSGKFTNKNQGSTTICNLVRNVQDELRAFWEQEEVSKDQMTSYDNAYCENHFVKTTSKDERGRFIVSIPFKQPVENLGNSYGTALKRFHRLEQKLMGDQELKEQYIEFMRQYKELGHMTKVDGNKVEDGKIYYLPQHGVCREESLTTKLRVVFDGSCKSSNGISLNALQHVGPTIQGELFSILLRFRTYLYVLSADIEKMYRQVMVKPEERDYQRVLWRENHEDPLEHYTLNTVTYGTSSAPYLAIRALQQTANEWQGVYERASHIIKEDFYVYDLLTGANSLAEAITLHREINQILSSGCFTLRKWASNSLELLNEISAISTNANDKLYLAGKETQKTLGLIWAPIGDHLKYDAREERNSRNLTKREILSTIARIFDPLGLIGPCTITAKILLQELWLHKLQWDDAIPEAVGEKWRTFKENLRGLNDLQIPRYVPCFQGNELQLHAFSDASEVAYGSCVYIREVSQTGIRVNLLCAKSRVAPIKKLTIPRLELCGAVLSARLIAKVTASLRINVKTIYYWCDSTIVLSWIKQHPSQQKVFVGHRVTEIQDKTEKTQWHHVRTHDNPADMISRGTTPIKLMNSLWWHGPSWLEQPQIEWPVSFNEDTPEDTSELKERRTTLMVKNKEEEFLFARTSSFTKLQRVVGWMLRFKRNCQLRQDLRYNGALTLEELHNAFKQMVKLAQEECFSNELKWLTGNSNKLPKGQWVTLSPFTDTQGLIRVGGRLKNSNYRFDKKHPYLLSGKHTLAKMILQYEHIRLLHAGPQLMLASSRERVWITSAKNLCKEIVHKCVRCFMAKPISSDQVMGQLPRDRVTGSYPFYATGIDYAGPFMIRDRKGRGYKTHKCYICIFVCFATKALHIEPVTELTSDAFLAMFKRFISRRGRPHQIYSDNGSNFIGANSELKELGKFLKGHNEEISNSGKNEGMNWHFIPANSPHFGGLWEAGVKATKFHMKRILSQALLTFEEFLSVLVQIEGALNSRPIHTMSSSPDDYAVLTPAHFLMGRSATALPDPDLLDLQTNRLSRFQHLQQLVQQFWKTWSKTYMAELQQRPKWRTTTNNYSVGDLVIIKDDKSPPLQWKIGRISEVHPGADGIVRVVTIRTPTTTLRRAVTKVCRVPI